MTEYTLYPPKGPALRGPHINVIVAKIMNEGPTSTHISTPYRQGRIARAFDWGRESNPWRGTAHANEWDWNRGYDAEPPVREN